MLEEQARHLLTEGERQTMSYYLDQYRDGHVGVEQLVIALFELFNTHAKVKPKKAFLWVRSALNSDIFSDEASFLPLFHGSYNFLYFLTLQEFSL